MQGDGSLACRTPLRFRSSYAMCETFLTTWLSTSKHVPISCLSILALPIAANGSLRHGKLRPGRSPTPRNRSAHYSARVQNLSALSMLRIPQKNIAISKRLAEGTGFEPAKELELLNGLANQRHTGGFQRTPRISAEKNAEFAQQQRFLAGTQPGTAVPPAGRGDG